MDLPPAKAVSFQRKAFDAGVIQNFSRQSVPSNFNVPEVAHKLRRLGEERASLQSHSERVPGIFGLLAAEIETLEKLSAQFEAYQNRSRVDLCIAPQ